MEHSLVKRTGESFVHLARYAGVKGPSREIERPNPLFGSNCAGFV